MISRNKYEDYIQICIFVIIRVILNSAPVPTNFGSGG